jgi:hypothetical protein
MGDLSLWNSNDQTSKSSENDTSKINPVNIMITASALLVIGLICYFIVDKFIVQTPTKIPLISAPKGPYKIRPEDPGGITFPHQDKFVYSKISQNKQYVEERVLPESERPINLPKKAIRPKALADQVVVITKPVIKQPIEQLQPPEPLPAPRKKIIKLKAQAVKKPVASNSSFDDDLAKLLSGNNNSAQSEDLVIPKQIPQDSPLHATTKKIKISTSKGAKSQIKTRYRLQLATLPSSKAAEQESKRLIDLSKLSYAQFEIQGFTNSSGEIVYRIFYGKFKSERKAQKARKMLQKKGLHPIVLKIG